MNRKKMMQAIRYTVDEMIAMPPSEFQEEMRRSVEQMKKDRAAGVFNWGNVIMDMMSSNEQGGING